MVRAPQAPAGAGVTHYTYRTPFGQVTLQASPHALERVAFGRVALAGPERPSALTNRAANQLQEYFGGKRRVFDVPLALAGTEFQRAVWDELLRIPYGQTRSYSQVAAAIGHPRASRAVGQANNRNPLPIFVPCHRVVAADGSLGGYAFGVKTKQFLLDLEASVVHAAPGKGKGPACSEK